MIARVLALIFRIGAAVTGTIAAGASRRVNRDHAPDQPAGVAGHHSAGRERGAPAGQIP
jgi:hypothetical protein